MNPNERYQRNRARYHALVRRHDMTGPNIGLFLNDLQQLVDEIGREDLTDAEAAVPPSVAALRRGGMWPDKGLWAEIERQAQRRGLSQDEIADAATAWLMSGNKKGNFTGALDWAQSGQRSNMGPVGGGGVRSGGTVQDDGGVYV